MDADEIAEDNLFGGLRVKSQSGKPGFHERKTSWLTDGKLIPKCFVWLLAPFVYTAESSNRFLHICLN